MVGEFACAVPRVPVTGRVAAPMSRHIAFCIQLRLVSAVNDHTLGV